MWEVSLPVLQFSPVSIIPPLLHTHSSIYHPRCIMFSSQYFSFPLSVSFHHCSILIHLPPTLYNVLFPVLQFVFLPVLQFSPVSIIPPLLHTQPFIKQRRCIILQIYTVVKKTLFALVHDSRFVICVHWTECKKWYFVNLVFLQACNRATHMLTFKRPIDPRSLHLLS